MRTLILVILIFRFYTGIYSQTYYGRVIDAVSHKPVPNAAIYSGNSGIGVYSNDDGNFRINSLKPLENENLVVSCVGYQSSVIRINGPDCGRIKLIPVIYKLEEVLISGYDAEHRHFRYLDSLFQIYRKHYDKINSKAYFSFSAEEDTIPLEFREIYYNAVTSCRNGVEEMTVKTGRIGNNEKNFLTVNVSDIFCGLKMFSLSGNAGIPQSPANFRYRNMKKLFHFTTVGVTSGKDKYLMVLEPRSSTVPYFSVSLYIDKSKDIIEKIEYSLRANSFHYFYPLMPDDSVGNVDLKLVYYFDQINPYQISQAGISYGLNYYSNATNSNHFIRGSGKMILFDIGTHYPGVIPSDLFTFQNNDYRILSSLPYDSLFWEIPGVAPLSSKNKEFLDFFNIGKVFETYDRKAQEISLSKYMPWRSSPRVGFKDFDSISRSEHKKIPKVHDVYNLKKNDIRTNIVLNYFYIGDSLHLTSATLIDLVDSYFDPDTGYRMIAFINLNFDLAEAYRRMLVDEICSDRKFQKPGNEMELKDLYFRLNSQLADTIVLLKKETENGTNQEMLMVWLKHMKDKYQIERDDIAEQMMLEDMYVKGNKDVKKEEK